LVKLTEESPIPFGRSAVLEFEGMFPLSQVSGKEFESRKLLAFLGVSTSTARSVIQSCLRDIIDRDSIWSVVIDLITVQIDCGA
jgi:hypothetical protein